MKEIFKVKNIHLLLIGLSSILITIFSKINLGQINYVLPYLIGLCCYLIIFIKEKDTNNKAYFYLIPIVLIIAAYFIFKIDLSNIVLNIFVIPVLFIIFIFKLVNKDYKIGNGFLKSLFSIFPNRLFSNLKYLQNGKSKDPNKVKNIILGLLVGIFVGYIFLILLTSADDYFNAFIESIFHSIDLIRIFILIGSFVIMFSILANIYLNRSVKYSNNKKEHIEGVRTITVLSVINFVFMLFLISEISRLTNNFLKLPVEYTYSSYAREGFFQLLAITVINFLINIFMIYKTNILSENKTVKKLLLLLSGFSIMLIFNSYYRMYMYISNYGFTVLRLQVVLFLLMELIIFGLLIKKMISNNIFKDGQIYYLIFVIFYIANIYLCSNWFIKLLS